MTPRQRAFIGGVAAASLLAGGLAYAWRYVAPFVLAFFLAAVIDPLVTALCRHLPVGRGVGVVIVLCIALAALGGAVVAIVANLGSELEHLVDALPGYASQLQDAFDGLSLRMDTVWAVLPPSVAESLRPRPEQWTAAVQGAVGSMLAMLARLPQALFVAIIGGLATYFISKDRHGLWKGLLETVPPEWRDGVVRFRDEVVGGALGILRAQLTLVGLTAVASIVGLALIGVPYAWALGMTAGLLDLAPFLGPSAVFLPAAAGYLLLGSPGKGLALTVVWMGIVVARQLVEPHLFGAGLGLHPVTTLAALYIGVQAVGPGGFFVGPLFLIVAKALFVVTTPGRDGPHRRQ